MSLICALSVSMTAMGLLAQDDAAGGAAAMGLICVFAVIGIAALIFWIWTIVDAVKNPRLSDNTRLVWILVIVFTGVIGSLIYLVAGRNG